MSPSDHANRSDHALGGDHARRAAVLDVVADAVVAAGAARVGVDGVDGVGKTVFADDLATGLRDRGVPVVRAGVDDWHRPRAVRYRRGRDSPEGFWLDSYQYERMRAELLEP